MKVEELWMQILVAIDETDGAIRTALHDEIPIDWNDEYLVDSKKIIELNELWTAYRLKIMSFVIPLTEGIDDEDFVDDISKRFHEKLADELPFVVIPYDPS